MSAPVKLVIWDLDETLWSGTISESEVELLAGRADLLNALVDRGIMVSISSKNDEAVVRPRLEALGLWDLFIFPRINWEPKGTQIRDLIEAAQLRAENVLFVEDLALNREEARHYAPGIQLADPNDAGLGVRFEAILASGKDDRTRSRLAEYRILEAKASAAARFGDDAEFLRSCDIHVALIPRPSRQAERIHELIGRTNQLNYTKRRIDREQVQALIDDPAVESYAVRVRDRFGDYGLVGFAAVRAGAVEQLAFSCRILGMGVERELYARLGSPAIQVAEPVSAPLIGPAPDWLAVEIVADEAPPPIDDIDERLAGRQDVLFVGGCDLAAAIAFIADRDRVATYLNYSPPDRPKLIVHRDSIDFLLADRLTEDQRRYVVRSAPFLDEGVFDAPDWAAYEHVVYSPLIDYVQAKYVNDALPGFYCSFGDVLAPAFDDERVAALVTRYGLDADTLHAFAAEWRPVQKPDPVWRTQLLELLGRMVNAQTVTVILGATDTHGPLDAARFETHRRANELVRSAAAGFGNVRCVEVNPFIHGPTDFTNSIRHYSRRVYRDIAGAVSERIGALGVAEPPAPTGSDGATREPSRNGRQRPESRLRRVIGRAVRQVTTRPRG